MAQKRLHDFFGFRIIKFTKDDDSNEKKKTHKNAKAIVVSGLDFQESDPPFYKQTLLRMIATGMTFFLFYPKVMKLVFKLHANVPVFYMCRFFKCNTEWSHSL